MKFKTPYNAHEFEQIYEKTVGPSMTMPDQSLTVMQVMARYASGQPIYGNSGVPVYNEDRYVPDFEHMDLADREEYYAEHLKEVTRMRKELRKKESEESLKKRKQQFDAAIDREIARRASKDKGAPGASESAKADS